MEVSKERLEHIKNMLDDIITLMELHEVDYVGTSCNTYGLNDDFISLGRDGYLDLERAIEKLDCWEEN